MVGFLCRLLVPLAMSPVAAHAYMRPELIDPPAVCSKDYPAAAARVRAQGSTLLTFRLLGGGGVANVKIAQSSGNADLDAAAVACVGNFRYRNPQSLRWPVRITWRFDGKTGSALADIPHRCGRDGYPQAERSQGIEGTTKLSFTVDAGGDIRDIAVSTSSGNANLDAAAVECAAFWRYRPATQDGIAFAKPWQAQVVWKLP